MAIEPIILIHGYSAESEGFQNRNDLAGMYGSLIADLGKLPFVPPIETINLSRYVSLDDRVDLEDITLALDRVLRVEHPQLLSDGFNAIIHSTGALVMRNWVRRCSPKPSPLKRLIHLAGANLGSGWAHIGESQLVKWLRFIGQGGTERGLAVLDGLELGSNWALELHRHFLLDGNSMLHDYRTMEFTIIGTQVPAEWMLVPIRYGKEDGSDGVVRVSASNLNFNYMRIVPRSAPTGINWREASEFAERVTAASQRGEVASDAEFAEDRDFAGGYYTVADDCRPDDPRPASRTVPGTKTRLRPFVPFAIPYQCAHSNETVGIIHGTATRKDVLPLIQAALGCSTEVEYAEQAMSFDATTQRAYERVNKPKHNRGLWEGLKDALRNYLDNPQGQYDRHAQLIIRVRDQIGKPLHDSSIHFNSLGGDQEPEELMSALFQDHHRNNNSPHTHTFYLRTDYYDRTAKDWLPRIPRLHGADLEIDCADASTKRILFVPLRMRVSSEQLQQWIRPHETTIIDVELLRLPSNDTFVMF
jgi:hypothetical protein